MSDEFVTIKLHLGSGKEVSTTTAVQPDMEVEEVAQALVEQIANGNEGRPHWLLVENLLVFTGAVSAIEVI